MDTIGTPVGWAGFTLLVLVMLAVDLLAHRHAHEVRAREALAWTIVWIGLALAFFLVVLLVWGFEPALEFLAGYLIEKALSVDNLFVFMVVFAYFGVPAALQHRVLFWGILGALVLRAVFIAVGAALLHSFEWVMYVFGAFLIFTGGKLLLQHAEEVHPERNPVLRLFRRLVPSVPDYRGRSFVVREDGRLLATPLLTVLVVVEATDVVFAVDSIPAVFAVTDDPFIVYTSNVFAILGLRALYFVLSGMLGRFHHLKYGLGLVLVFVGGKMVLEDVVHVPIAVSLSVVALLLAGSIATSLSRPPVPPPLPRPPDDAAGGTDA